MTSLPSKPQNRPVLPARLNRDKTKVMCAYGRCTGKLGDVLKYGGFAVVVLPDGFYRGEDGVWRFSEGAKARMGKDGAYTAPYPNNERHVRRYAPDQPAQQYRTAQAPPLKILRNAAQIRAWVQSVTGSHPGYTFVNVADETSYRQQTEAPCRIECPDCHNVSEVTVELLELAHSVDIESR